jgi:precorrin-3B synthase
MTAADACPGLLDLHEARDGHVARIRLPGGYATGPRLRGLAALASRFGDGCVDLTARGNVQLRGVRAGEAGELARRAALAGLLPSPAHDRARNITASPLAGLAGHPELRSLVRALDRAVRVDPGLAALPGRFLFCLDDGTGRAGLSGCDVGIRRLPPGADLIVAGRETGLRGQAQHVVRYAIAAAGAFLRQRRTASAAIRVADPVDGEAPAVTRVAALPDGGAAVAAAVGGTLGDRVTDIVSRLPLGPVADAAPPAVVAAPVAVVAAPLARLTATQLRLLGRMVRPGEVARLAAAGRVVLPLAEPVDAALTRLAGAGLLVSDDHVLSAVTACSGMSCTKSLADVRSLATRVPGPAIGVVGLGTGGAGMSTGGAGMSTGGAGMSAVHWAGCGRRCGRPADAAVVVAISAGQFTLGDGPGARTFVAGPG